MFVIFCLLMKFHLPSSSGLLIATLKPKTNYRLRVVTILFYEEEDLLWYIISRTHIKWHNCRSNLTNSCVGHVVLIDRGKLKCTKLECPPAS